MGEREGGRGKDGRLGRREGERQGKYKQTHMYMYMYNLRSV